MNNFNKLYHTDLELRLAAYVFEAHEAIIITDNSLKVLRVNKAYTDITGFAPEEIIGKTTKIYISSIQNKDYYRNMREIITANGYWEGELYNQRKNGELYPALLSISAVKDKKGNVSHYVGHLKDLADYKNKECALSRKFDEERVLSNLMNVSFKPMDEFLQQAIEQITAIEWLRLEPTGAIFLTRNEGKANMMKLVCNYNLDQHVSEQCAHIIFGECLCGRAARSKQIQFCSDIDDPRHEWA